MHAFSLYFRQQETEFCTTSADVSKNINLFTASQRQHLGWGNCDHAFVVLFNIFSFGQVFSITELECKTLYMALFLFKRNTIRDTFGQRTAPST